MNIVTNSYFGEIEIMLSDIIGNYRLFNVAAK
jgi:hypothetical protein